MIPYGSFSILNIDIFFNYFVPPLQLPPRESGVSHSHYLRVHTNVLIVAMDQISEEQMEERTLAADLRTCVASLDGIDGEHVQGEFEKLVNTLVLK